MGRCRTVPNETDVQGSNGAGPWTARLPAQLPWGGTRRDYCFLDFRGCSQRVGCSLEEADLEVRVRVIHDGTWSAYPLAPSLGLGPLEQGPEPQRPAGHLT